MNQQDKHLQTLDEDLKRAESDVARLRAQLRTESDGATGSLGNTLDALSRDLNRLRADLEAGRGAEPDTWDEVKTGLDLTWREIRTGLEMLMGRPGEGDR